MERQLNIPLHGSSVQTVRKHAAALADVLLSKFSCGLTVDGVDIDGDPGAGRHVGGAVPQEKKYEHTLPSGVKVSVWKADLTKFRVDAVVNAANEKLQHIGGLAYALSVAGGPKIQRESADYVDKHGPLQTGEAIVTGAGDLPCRRIIHAVGPQLSYGSDYKQSEPLLERAIMNILGKVQDNDLQTAAIPAISSGLFNYPLHHCANTIVGTVKRFYETSPVRKPLPKEILLANNDDPSVKEMERACREILGPSSLSYSQAAAKKTKGASSPSTPTVQLGGVRVILRKGYIEEQQTDVIVNTASITRNLSTGQISKALLSKAGQQMQQDLYSAPRGNYMIPTRAYGLKCKEVYHTFCVEKGRTGAEQLLFDSVNDCLWSAAGKHKSITFPAIGTGALNFTQREVAHIMTDAVAAFAVKCRMKLEVHFVIFPSDHSIFQAFQDQMKSLPSRVSHLSQGAGLVDTSEPTSSRAETPQISLMSHSEESLHEAQKWLDDLLRTSPVVISNNFIQHLGDEEHQQLFGLSRGGVAIEEFLSGAHACITVDGTMPGEAAGAALQVEAMLCKVHDTFVREEEKEMAMMTSTNGASGERQLVECPSKEFRDVAYGFRNACVTIKKVERVVNNTLKTLFELKKGRLSSSRTRTMYQCIPAQFCEMVTRIGVQAECAPPEDPKFGQGIYFAYSVEKAMKVWKEKKERYLYIVEAEVLTGNSTAGRPGLILPPPMERDPTVLYDSVHGGKEISVIFSGYQALPKYIITCERRDSTSV